MRSTEFCDVATARNMRKAAQAAPYLRDPIADRRWQRDHCARNQTADDVSTRLERQGAAGSSDKAPSMGTIPAKIRFASERTSSSRLPAIVARVSGIKLDHESLRSHPAADSSSRKIVCDTPRGLWRPLERDRRYPIVRCRHCGRRHGHPYILGTVGRRTLKSAQPRDRLASRTFQPSTIATGTVSSP